MILALLAVLQVARPAPAPPSATPGDTLPRVTLAEALRRAARVDPDYVRALGRIDNAEWSRRAARLAFLLPSITASVDATKYSTEFFNIGTGSLQSTAVTGRLTAGYELFSARKFVELGRSSAELASAEAGELEQRFLTALETERDYNAVLAGQELARVARERVRRAEEQLGVARARVLSGAAVQSDSLQLVLELVRARAALLNQESALRVARLQLGRRIGEDRAVDAVPADTAPAPELPLSLPEAVAAAVAQGPTYQAARANERAAEAQLRAERGGYLPEVTLAAGHARFDNRFFPGARNVSSVTLTVSLPVWNQGAREIAVSQARVNRDVFRAIREDLERAVRRDVTEAYDAYTTARATVELQTAAVAAARENFRVQETRYRAGATTVLDVLEAQLRLTEAEADLVQARYATRLALAGLEAILGRRLFPDEDVP
ncbi:MAG TPA: TolC family protein [Gemmatimonadales bacterium]|nr:TolC family protein [Gemmatimonadales bacterium]